MERLGLLEEILRRVWYPLNQEDSLVINKGSIDRGLFNGCKFTFKKTELEQREEFGNPDIATTSDIKAGSYAKLKDGIIKEGTHIEKNDAIIGKYMRLPKTSEQELPMSDRSIIYKEREKAIVHSVIVDRNEDDERFCKVCIRKPRRVSIADKFCLTGDHEVLTLSGWKNIKEINISDTIATLNPESGCLEYHKPTGVVNFEHTGKMYDIKARGVELTTTLNHKMYVKEKNKDFKLVEARELYGKRVYYKKDCINKVDDVFKFTLPKYIRVQPKNIGNINYDDVQVDMDSFLEFLGIYLAEGWIDNSSCIRIAVHKERVKTKLIEILPNIESLYTIYQAEPDYMYIRNPQLSSYLKQFGKSYNKYLPRWCYSLSKRQSALLLNGLMLGDGYYDNRRKSWEYYTGSKELADGVQILAIMSGQTASMSIKNTKGEIVIINGVETKRNSDQYRIYVSNYALNKEPLVGGATTQEQIIDYIGKVYCLVVPNHIFMARKNNTYAWTGNSSRAGLTLSGPRWVVTLA